MTRLPLLLAGALLLAGCGGSGGGASNDVAAPAAGSSASPAACPAAAASTISWPAGIPGDLPKPPGTTVTSAKPGPGGVTVVRFSTPESLRQGVLFLVRNLQPAGYTLGRGDAEAAEADAPFTKGDLRGIYRMVAREPCATDWLLAVTHVGSSSGSATQAPLLPPSTATASPSPLPFG